MCTYNVRAQSVQHTRLQAKEYERWVSEEEMCLQDAVIFRERHVTFHLRGAMSLTANTSNMTLEPLFSGSPLFFNESVWRAQKKR